MAERISADYLVIGAGAMGMAFVDTLLSDTKATVVMVDRDAKPGGHWTTAYPYNGLAWGAHPQTAAWVSQARLDLFGTHQPRAPTDPAQAAEFHAAVKARVQGICNKIDQLISQLPEKDAARARAQLAGF